MLEIVFALLLWGLGAEDFDVRELSQAALGVALDVTRREDLVKKGLSSPDLEVRKRCGRALGARP